MSQSGPDRPLQRMTSILTLDDLGVSLQSSESREVSLQRLVAAMDKAIRAPDGPEDESVYAELLAHVLTAALKTVAASDGALLVLDEETSDLVFILTRGSVPEEKLAWKRLAARTGIAGWAAEHGETAVVFDAATDPRFHGDFDQEFEFQTKTVIASPIIRGGRTYGVIEALNKAKGEGFNRADTAVMEAAASASGIVLSLLSKGSDTG